MILISFCQTKLCSLQEYFLVHGLFACEIFHKKIRYGVMIRNIGKEKWRNFDMGYQMARTLTDQSFFKSQMKMINQQEECINFSIDFSDFRQNLNFFVKSWLLTQYSVKNVEELPRIKAVFQQPIHIQTAKPGAFVSLQERVFYVGILNF